MSEQPKPTPAVGDIPAPVAGGNAGAQGATVEELQKQLSDKDAELKRTIEQRHKAQEKAKAYDEIAPKLKAFEDKEKTDAQRASEETLRLTRDAETARAELGKQSRINVALRAGASDPDYVAWKIEQAGPDAKAEEVIEGLRKSQPGLFAAPTAPAPKPAPVAAGGGSPPPVSNKSKQEQLESIRGELKSRRGQMMVGDNLVRVTQLTRAASQLERELRSGS